MARLVALGLAIALAGCRPAAQLPATVTLDVDGQRIEAEVAITAAQQQRGLMGRSSIGAGRGMLFPLRRPALVCMWMRGTSMPLTAAFLTADGQVINVADMAPETEVQHCSAAPATFVLEMPQGSFPARRIGPPYRVNGVAAARI